MNTPTVAVLSGGISGEREVSQRSAAAVFNALQEEYQTELFDVAAAALPEGLDPERHVIFSTLHGIFGEDGEMQTLLDAAGFSYAGSNAASSRLCMDKAATKRAAASAGVSVAAGVDFSGQEPMGVEQILSVLGDDLVIKPNNEGSSIGLHFVRGAEELVDVLSRLSDCRWLAEARVAGREFTVGILHGRGMGVVEIIPHSGRFDYTSKYTKGLTDYRYPADIPEDLAARLRREAEAVFEACGCRDFARVDFMLDSTGEPFFLEINTLPGLTETSLLPKSASCENIDFRALAAHLVTPAIQRFNQIASTTLT